MSEFDIFVSSMSIATLDHMKSLKNITLDGNTTWLAKAPATSLSVTVRLPCWCRKWHAIFRFSRSAEVLRQVSSPWSISSWTR